MQDRVKRSSKQFNVQSDRTHEEVDVSKPLTGHIRGKGLRKSHSLHDAVLDSHNESLLLIRACTNTDRGKELPDVDIFTSVDRSGKYGREGRLKGIEEFVVDSDPVLISIALPHYSTYLPLLPLVLFGTSSLLDKLSPAENHGQHTDADSSSCNNIDIDIKNKTQNTSDNI